MKDFSVAHSVDFRWREGAWRDALPPSDDSMFWRGKNHEAWPWLPPSLRESTQNWIALSQELVQRPAKPIALNRVRQWMEGWESWSQMYGDYLTWPASNEGWRAALIATVDRHDQTYLPMLLGVYPDMVLDVLQQGLVNDSSPLLQWFRATQSPVVTPDVTVVAPATTSVDLADVKKGPATDVKKYQPTADVKKTAEAILAVLRRLSSSNQAFGAEQASFDDELKRFPKNDGCDTDVQWFEERLLPALVTLNAEQLGQLAHWWPPHRRYALPKPVEFVEQNRLWFLLKSVEPPAARAVLFQDVLPKLLDFDHVSFETRYKMAPAMLNFTKNRPDLFLERLRLWTAWGGKMLEEEVLPSEVTPSSQDVFNAVTPPRRSVWRWIQGQNIDAWIREASLLAHERGWTLPPLDETQALIAVAATSSPPSAPKTRRPR